MLPRGRNSIAHSINDEHSDKLSYFVPVRESNEESDSKPCSISEVLWYKYNKP